MKQKILSLLCVAILSTGAYAQTAAPTWSSDVACIVYSHCSTCHNPTSIAPFSLLSYQDAYLNMQSIKHDVSIKKMPPYLPSTSYQHYTDMRTLSTQEINTIVAWVDSGAPLGDTSVLIPAPTFSSSVVLTHPDLTARMADYVIPNTGADLYRCFVITPPQDTAQFISKLEVIPGDRSAVHHVLVFQDTAYSVVVADSLDPQSGYTNFGGTGSSTSKLIGAWVPGSGLEEMPTNMGIKLTKGSRIIMQIHYPVGSEGKLDSTRINIQYTTSSNVRNVSVAPILNYRSSIIDGPLVIPQDSVKTFHEKYTIPVDVTVLSVAPHAHLVCTKMKSFCVTPTNDTIPLIDIENWDFHWQGAHSFQKPIKIPAGSTLWGTALYDNTYNNPNGPRPITTVTAGEATADEMMLFYFWYMPYVAGDENIIVDTASHEAHYMNCVSSYVSGTSTGISEAGADNALRIYPNPTQSILNYKSAGEITEISITDIAGKLIKQISASGKEGQIPVGDMGDGLYFIRLQNSNGTSQTLRFTKD